MSAPAALAELHTVLGAGQPAHVTTAGVERVWNAATPEVRAALVSHDPHLIGNTEGVPLRDADGHGRYEANSVAIDRAYAQLQARVSSGSTVPAETPERLAALDALRQPRTMQVPGADGRPVVTQVPRQYAAFDPAGNGRLVEVLGDLGTAKHVAVLVPGVGAGIDAHAGLGDSAAHMLRAARGQGATLATPGGPKVAVVTWQNYDAPRDRMGAALGSGLAAASRGLDAFQAELRTRLAPGATTTAVGIGFGAYAVRTALESGTTFDRFIGVAPDLWDPAKLPAGVLARVVPPDAPDADHFGRGTASLANIVRIWTGTGSVASAGGGPAPTTGGN